MNTEIQKVVIQGRSLHRLVLSPDEEHRGSLLFFHGQGDFIDRYPPMLEGFVRAGYQCLLTDLPGHGRSPGRRGVVPDLGFVDELFQNSLSLMTGSRIIAGHSMGGLMALRYLLSEPQHFDSAWVSSPLLDPLRQASPLMRRILPIASAILPWLTVSTGVSSADCGDRSNGRTPDEKEEEVLYHSRISIGWGRHLRDAAEVVKSRFPAMPTEMPILFTQGKDDRICPPQILSDRLAKLGSNQIHFEQIEDARHEPFSGSTREEFLARLNGWISQFL